MVVKSSTSDRIGAGEELGIDVLDSLTGILEEDNEVLDKHRTIERISGNIIGVAIGSKGFEDFDDAIYYETNFSTVTSFP